MTRPTCLSALLLTFGLLAATGCALDEGDIADDDAIDEPEIGTAETIGSNDDKCWAQAIEVFTWDEGDGKYVYGGARADCRTGSSTTIAVSVQKRRSGATTWTTCGLASQYTVRGADPSLIFDTASACALARGTCYRSSVRAFGQTEAGARWCY